MENFTLFSILQFPDFGNERKKSEKKNQTELQFQSYDEFLYTRVLIITLIKDYYNLVPWKWSNI